VVVRVSNDARAPTRARAHVRGPLGERAAGEENMHYLLYG